MNKNSLLKLQALLETSGTNLNTPLHHYKSLLPWNLARIRCFVQIILGVIIASNVQLRIPMNLNKDFDLMGMAVPIQIKCQFRFNSNNDSRTIRTRVEEKRCSILS